MNKGQRKRGPPKGGFKKDDARTKEISRLANIRKAEIRAANPTAFSYRPIKQLFTEILAQPDLTDEQKRSKSITLAEKIYQLAREGEQWAAHIIYERVEGRVPNVIRADTRRRYEELGDDELRQALTERLRRNALPA